ncbi:hypothetical protein Taro_019150 [Colocasia esculenta]|uniref:Transmembrane protein n=1 Tax=Colocasia esculenta TaxID=4460 RepID=A0A843UYE2_COLES|nr:hypothetical protein [Colocasia esculenta]
MAIASSQQSFLTSSTPLACVQNHHHRRRPKPAYQLQLGCRASMGKNTEPSPSYDGKMLAKLAMVAAAAGVLTLGSVGDAMAAKSGGRVGGQAFRSSAPRYSGPRINNSRTNIYINPPVAPPLIGGYGFGSPFYGGWGWSPFTFFAPGPSVAVGVGGSFDIFVWFLVLGSVATVIRRFTRRREDEDDY